MRVFKEDFASRHGSLLRPRFQTEGERLMIFRKPRGAPHPSYHRTTKGRGFREIVGSTFVYRRFSVRIQGLLGCAGSTRSRGASPTAVVVSHVGDANLRSPPKTKVSRIAPRSTRIYRLLAWHRVNRIARRQCWECALGRWTTQRYGAVVSQVTKRRQRLKAETSRGLRRVSPRYKGIGSFSLSPSYR